MRKAKTMKDAEKSARPKRRKQTPANEVWRRFKKSKTAMLGLYIVIFLVLMAIFADVLADKSLTTQISGSERLSPPSWKHIFGTDHLGRDLFARMVHGSRISLSMGLLVVVLDMGIGSILGAACGYLGGLFDSIVMRICDILYCIPSMLLVMVIASNLGTGLVNLLIALCVGTVPSVIRLVRSQVINLSNVDYARAAKAFGSGNIHLIFRHILPNALGVIIVQATGMISGTVIAASGYSFLGFGVQPPTAEWGVILSDAKPYMLNAPYLMIIPGVAIVLSAMSMTLIGDGLRDALDPRLKN